MSHIFDAILDAIRDGNSKKVKRMVNEYPKIMHNKDGNGWTSLDIAIKCGRLEIAKFLSEKGVKPNVEKYYEDEISTPMKSVVIWGRTAILEWIIEKEVLPLDVLRNIKDRFGHTLMDNAIANVQPKMAEILWEINVEPNPDVYCQNYFSPVFAAVRSGHITILEWVFAKGVLPLRVLQIKDKRKRTPLDAAIAYERLETAALFRRLLHLDPVFLAMQRAKHDYHQCVLRRLPDELLDMVVEEVAQRSHLKVVWR